MICNIGKGSRETYVMLRLHSDEKSVLNQANFNSVQLKSVMRNF